MRAAFVPCLLLSALLTAFACSGGNDDDAIPTAAPEDLEAAELLTSAATAFAGLQGFHFVLTQESATIPLPPNFDLESAEGDIVFPDRFEAELETEVQGVNVSVDAIAIGSDTWITNPFTRQWQKLDVDLRDFADLAALLPSLLPAIQSPEIAGESTVDGVRSHRVVGTANSAELQDALPFSLPGRVVEVELWIGVDDSLPRRLSVVGQLISGESADAVRRIDLTRFNQPVRINPP